MVNMNRRNFVKAVGATGVLTTMSGVASARRPGPTIVEKAIELNSSDPYKGMFDILIAAVVAEGLDSTLSGNRQLTVFAPTDDAFNAIGISLGDDGLVVEEPAASVLDDVSLEDILKYHVSPGRRDAESVTSDDELPTLYSELIEVDGTELNGGQAEIIATDFECSNGIIHAIDGVLLP